MGDCGDNHVLRTLPLGFCQVPAELRQAGSLVSAGPTALPAREQEWDIDVSGKKSQGILRGDASGKVKPGLAAQY